jgi:hypothetical protein
MNTELTCLAASGGFTEGAGLHRPGPQRRGRCDATIYRCPTKGAVRSSVLRLLSRSIGRVGVLFKRPHGRYGLHQEYAKLPFRLSSSLKNKKGESHSG